MTMAFDFTLYNISPIQDYVHPDDHTQPTYEMTPWFKPFTVLLCTIVVLLLVCDSARWAEHLTEPLKGDSPFLLGFYC